MVYLDRYELTKQRENAIVDVLKNSKDGMNLREITEAVAGAYPTIRIDCINLVNVGRIVQTSQYRRGAIYVVRNNNTMPSLFYKGKPISFWDHFSKLGTRPADTINPVLSAAMPVMTIYADLFRHANPSTDLNPDTTKDREILRTRLLNIREILQEAVSNLDILINHEGLWGTDKQLYKVLGGVDRKTLSDAESTLKQDFNKIMTVIKERAKPRQE